MPAARPAPSPDWRELPAQQGKPADLDPVAALAAGQWGVVARLQLLRCGLSASAVDRRVADGRLVRMHRGVDAYGRRLGRGHAA